MSKFPEYKTASVSSLIPYARNSRTHSDEQMQAKADDYKFRYSEQGDVVPSRAGLCCWLGISRSTSYGWEKAHVKFMRTLEAISVLQENIALVPAKEATNDLEPVEKRNPVLKQF